MAPPTSLPCFCRNSISCCVKVVMEMDLTLWGGFSPRLQVGEIERGRGPVGGYWEAEGWSAVGQHNWLLNKLQKNKSYNLNSKRQQFWGIYCDLGHQWNKNKRSWMQNSQSSSSLGHLVLALEAWSYSVKMWTKMKILTAIFFFLNNRSSSVS